LERCEVPPMNLRRSQDFSSRTILIVTRAQV
jgi:hypothetical protein